MKYGLILIYPLALLFIGGCATIPKQAPMLSEQLGIQINTIQASHINLLHSFFDNKREKIDQFIVKEWIPLFAKNFFNDPDIEEAWDDIVKSGNKEDRLRMFILVGPRLQAQINVKRMELIKPLDELENELENKIRNEYNVARSINNSITSFLYSASKVEENRTRYLEKIGVTDEVIGNALSKTEDIVNTLVSAGESFSEKEALVKSYLDKLKSVTENLSTNLKNQ